MSLVLSVVEVLVICPKSLIVSTNDFGQTLAGDWMQVRWRTRSALAIALRI
ncbi:MULTISPECIES: hypothetical protein [unclassified Nostoc]|uniref:hypothetical protein n=1 Tax=unclassified Nostoc TaxID=2593658 RepID=UPI002AD2127D|nr:hypothetical protein [Nostoc sp. DedQUE03]MDZ7973535.1 hypothetical protein [Nostoc sp. DedQUE03]